MACARYGCVQNEEGLLSRIIAMGSNVEISTVTGGVAAVADLYIANGQNIGALKRHKEVDEFLTANRIPRWEDALTDPLDAGTVTHAAVKDALHRLVCATLTSFRCRPIIVCTREPNLT